MDGDMADQLSGRHLRIGVDDPESNPASPYGSLERYNVDSMLKLIGLLQTQLNFTYELVFEPAENSLGQRMQNGSWSGLIGMLQRRAVDVVAFPVPFLPSFVDAVDLSIPLGQDDWVTLQRKSSGRNSLSGLLSPFELEVWLLVLASMIAMIPIMYLAYRVYLKFQPGTISKFRGQFSDYVLFVVVSILRQDHKLRISIHSQRVLMASWWIAGLVLTTYYTANLTASLARPFKEKSVQEPAELALPAYKDVRWLILQDSPLSELIQSEQGLDYIQILGQQLKSGRGRLVDSIDTAANLTAQGYVWFGNENTLLEVMLADYRTNRANSMSSSKTCNFQLTERAYLKVEFGFAFGKDSPLREPFNKAIGMISQAGFSEYIHRPSFTGKNPCSLTGGYTSKAMKMDDFLGLFYIASFGIGVSFLAFVTEKVTFGYRQWRQVKKTIQPKLIYRKRNTENVDSSRPVIVSQPDLLEIDKLIDEIDQLLRPAYDYRVILHELIYPKRS